MNDLTFYVAGSSPALRCASMYLTQQGYRVVEHPSAEVTHLLLPVPSFEPNGRIKGGLNLTDLLPLLPKDITIIGGNLAHPALDGYPVLDLLQDPMYLAQNAAITAHCAVKVALAELPVTLDHCQVLIIGWGRIGKCLASLLRAMGAAVTVAARKETDRAILRALGYEAVDTDGLSLGLIRYRVLFNTADHPILNEKALTYCRPDCLKIDLASTPGIAGQDVIHARGLPGKDAPETSGILIARTCIRLAARKE